MISPMMREKIQKIIINAYERANFEIVNQISTLDLATAEKAEAIAKAVELSPIEICEHWEWLDEGHGTCTAGGCIMGLEDGCPRLCVDGNMLKKKA